MSGENLKKKMISRRREVCIFLIETANTARQELEMMERQTEITQIHATDSCCITRDFINNIISQLSEYAKDIGDCTSIMEDASNDKEKSLKRGSSLKRSKFSLKKEKDEELTQDEFLQVYKIDMTEDLNSSFPCVAETKFGDAKDDDATNSDNSCHAKSDNASEGLSNGNIENSGVIDNLEDYDTDVNEINILKNIGCDMTDTNSDSGTSTFSATTFILDHDFNINDSEAKLNENTNAKDNGVSKRINEEKTEDDNLNATAISDCDNKRPIIKRKLDEHRHIENLINLNNLERNGKPPENPRPTKKTRSEQRQVQIDSDDKDASSDSDKTDCSLEEVSVKKENTETPHINEKATALDQRNRLLKVILECMSDPSDFLEDGSTNNGSNSSTDIEKENKNKTSSNGRNDKNGDVKTADERAKIPEDLNSSDERKRKRKKWRRCKLLTEKLFDDTTDDEKENDPEQRKRPRRTKKPRRNSETKDTDKDSSSFSFDCSDTDFHDFSVGSQTVGSDSSSSDNELIKIFKDAKEQSTPNRSTEDVKTGRRNIRTVQSFAQLNATTKKARKEEEARRERLHNQSQLVLEVPDDEGLVLDVDKKTKRPLVVVDERITERLKTHQKEGVRFMWNVCFESLEAAKTSPGTGCILAHCMGLGKSFQVAALIHTLFSHEDIGATRIMIVCPLSTVSNWENEFSICHDVAENKINIRRWLLIDSKDQHTKRKIVINWYLQKGVLILGYESFQSLLKLPKDSTAIPKGIVEALLDPGPDLVVCDEGHLIKNGKISRTRTLSKIRTKRRIVLTGTPMQNNLKEYYFMVDFVKPNLLGTMKEFSNRFINPIVNGGYENSTDIDIKLMRKRSHVLHEYLKDTVQRYEMSELVRYLPKKLDYVIFVPLQPLQMTLYQAFMDNILKSDEGRCFLNNFLRLRNIWTHPNILVLRDMISRAMNKQKEVDTIVAEPEVQGDIPKECWQSKCPDDIQTNIEYGPKMKIMLEIIRESIRLNDNVLIFGSHLTELDAIEMFLQSNGWDRGKTYLRMDGTVAPHVRADYCNKFNNQDNGLKIFLLSQKIGGLGLNLVAANRIILMGVNFNPAIDNQSLFRAYRFGQGKQVYVYRLVSMGTMEEVIYERSITKQAMSLRVVDEHQIARHYKSCDLHALYRFQSYEGVPKSIHKRPADDVLAAILRRCDKEIFKYQCHQDLLENRPEEQLNEEEQRLAWDEFRKEQEAAYEKAVAAEEVATIQTAEPGIVLPSNGQHPFPNVVQNVRPQLNNTTNIQNFAFVPNLTQPWPVPSVSNVLAPLRGTSNVQLPTIIRHVDIRRLLDTGNIRRDTTSTVANAPSMSTIVIDDESGNSIRNPSAITNIPAAQEETGTPPTANTVLTNNVQRSFPNMTNVKSCTIEPNFDRPWRLDEIPNVQAPFSGTFNVQRPTVIRQKINILRQRGNTTSTVGNRPSISTVVRDAENGSSVKNSRALTNIPAAQEETGTPPTANPEIVFTNNVQHPFLNMQNLRAPLNNMMNVKSFTIEPNFDRPWRLDEIPNVQAPFSETFNAQRHTVIKQKINVSRPYGNTTSTVGNRPSISNIVGDAENGNSVRNSREILQLD